MKAVIMAGGEGTRLRPLTSNIPKPMMPLANKPMMEHVVRLLRQHDFTDIVVTLAFLPQAIRTYFGDGSEFGVRMRYATEEMPLGTGDAVRKVCDTLPQFDGNWLILYGDTPLFRPASILGLLNRHHLKHAHLTLLTAVVDRPLPYGRIIRNAGGQIIDIIEDTEAKGEVKAIREINVGA